MAEPKTGVQNVCELDPEGNVRACHEEATSSSIQDFESTEWRVRCWAENDGALVNCSMVRGPGVAQDQIVEAIKKRRVPPRPVEGWVWFVGRVGFGGHP